MGSVSKIRQVKLVGRKIRQLRKSRRLTQTELSGLIGVQQSDLSRMEKGEYKVSLDTLFKILAVFEMNVGTFFEEIVTDSLAPTDVTVLKSYKKLNRRSQQDVRDFITFKQMQDQEQEDDEVVAEEEVLAPATGEAPAVFAATAAWAADEPAVQVVSAAPGDSENDPESSDD